MGDWGHADAPVLEEHRSGETVLARANFPEDAPREKKSLETVGSAENVPAEWHQHNNFPALEVNHMVIELVRGDDGEEEGSG